MALLDHFHPPVSALRHWESFHGRWAHAISDALNRNLPAGYFSEAQVSIGGLVEIDVATQEAHSFGGPSANGGTATATLPISAPPVAAQAMPLVFPDEFEVRLFETRSGPTLVGAIELVSPRNKDRPEARRVFIAKSLNYLSQGIGLVVVDVVTERAANLHDELVRWMGLHEPYLFPPDSRLYAVAYRPRRTQASGDHVELAKEQLHIGQPLPAMPLALRGGPELQLDLDAAYNEARARSRM
jgi:Protein of unknown function (DUF4058)